jgi:hypothetical protein
MKALYIRIVLFFIGPAIRREIERNQEAHDAFVRACVAATERCIANTVKRVSEQSSGAASLASSLASEDGVWELDFTSGALRLKAAVIGPR